MQISPSAVHEMATGLARAEAVSQAFDEWNNSDEPIDCDTQDKLVEAAFRAGVKFGARIAVWATK